MILALACGFLGGIAAAGVIFGTALLMAWLENRGS